MKKGWLWILLGIVVVAGIIIIFKQDKPTSNPIPEGQTMEPVILEDQEYEQDKEEVDTHDVLLMKAGELLEYEDLDEIEKMFIDFISDFYNVDGTMTEDEFMKYIEEKHSSVDGKLIGLLREAKEKLPEYGERQLFGVSIFPEYYKGPTMYVLPLSIFYVQEGERRSSTQRLAIGHYDNEYYF